MSSTCKEVDENRRCLTCGDKCPGFKLHSWRNTCQHCKCVRGDHDVYLTDSPSVRERLGLIETGRPDKHSKYSWVPPGLSKEKIEEYMEQLDNNKIPRVGSDGARYRMRQIIEQIPKQDLSSADCRHLKTEEEKTSYELFIKQRNKEALDTAQVLESIGINSTCERCAGELDPSDMAVRAERAGEGVFWHVACFVCDSCQELLVDLTYCLAPPGEGGGEGGDVEELERGLIYCERHYAELLRPRCAACDELIFSGEYTKAMDKDWHSSHFSCVQCDLNLTGHRYILRDEHAYCIKCYESLFAHTCEQCHEIIGTDSKDLSYKDLHWHEKCFRCSVCSTSLVDQPFATNTSRLYCALCHDNQFSTRCDKCSQVFRADMISGTSSSQYKSKNQQGNPKHTDYSNKCCRERGMKKYEYNGKQWHEHCFICQECKKPITSSSFVPRDEHVICVPCYEQTYAQRCTKCSQVISVGGVTYKSTSWHRECFTCTHCNKILAGEKFTSHNDKPYCADCYGLLFAKKCANCTKPITGLGSTKFVSFEDRHWHSDCFQCSKCQVSLVGQGFLTEGLDIICPECSQLG